MLYEQGYFVESVVTVQTTRTSFFYSDLSSHLQVPTIAPFYSTDEELPQRQRSRSLASTVLPAISAQRRRAKTPSPKRYSPNRNCQGGGRRNGSPGRRSSNSSLYPAERRRERGGSMPGQVKITEFQSSSDESDITTNHVLVLGAANVGKKTLSACLESEGKGRKKLKVATDPNGKDHMYKYEAIVLLYSVTDWSSFEYIRNLRGVEGNRTVVLVGNKNDLERCRVVSEEDGLRLATTLSCKFIEVSATLDLNTPQLISGLCKQIQLRSSRSPSPSRNQVLLNSRKVIDKILNTLLDRKWKSCLDFHNL